MSGGGGSSSDGGSGASGSHKAAFTGNAAYSGSKSSSPMGPGSSNPRRSGQDNVTRSTSVNLGPVNPGSSNPRSPHTNQTNINQSSNNISNDRLGRIASGQEPGYRADDSRPFGLSKEEAYRQGKITVNQRDAEPELTEQHERDVTRDLDFEEHWNLAPKAIRWSPTLRFLYASGKNLGEWASKKGWTWNSGTGKIYDNNNNEVGERHLMNTAAPDAPGLVSGQSNTQTTSGSYSASQWYANLGNTNTTGSNPFSFSTAFADAKAKQQTILGNPSAIRQLAVNESPFYNWLKENSLNKGIL